MTDADGWFSLSAAQFPDFAKHFDSVAPPRACKAFPRRSLAPSRIPTGIQLWSGFVARTAPGWGLLIRPPANLTRQPSL